MKLNMEPYRPRRTGSLGVAEVPGWTVKITGISADGELPGEAERAPALRAAARELPAAGDGEDGGDRGIAFVIVHRGEEALWVLVCWWRLDIMYERLLRADLGTTELRSVPPGGPTACVWELLVIDHERRAWVEHVLRRPDAPDLAGYLATSATVE